jgi:hypothetical protein
MGTFNISHIWREGVLGLEGFTPDKVGFDTDNPMVVIVDFDDL